MSSFNPNAVSKAAFIQLLEEARTKAGGVENLARKLEVNQRRISRWLAGNGPAYPVMTEMYVKVYRFARRTGTEN